MKKIIYILLLIMSMRVMYHFSSQDGTTSTLQSNVVIEIIDEVRDRVVLKDERLIKIKDKIFNKLRQYKKSTIVRKAAHFSIYAVIGGLAMILIYSISKQVFLSACLSFTFAILFAVFDERSQLAVDGRNGSLLDVFIDGSGALVSIIILSILFLTGKGIGYIFGKRDKEF